MTVLLFPSCCSMLFWLMYRTCPWLRCIDVEYKLIRIILIFEFDRVLICFWYQSVSGVSRGRSLPRAVGCLVLSASRGRCRGFYGFGCFCGRGCQAICGFTSGLPRIRGLKWRSCRWSSTIRSKILCLYCFCCGFCGLLSGGSCGADFTMTISKLWWTVGWPILESGSLILSWLWVELVLDCWFVVWRVVGWWVLILQRCCWGWGRSGSGWFFGDT